MEFKRNIMLHCFVLVILTGYLCCTSACPSRCVCTMTTVRCVQGFNRIPEKIPRNTTVLDLRFNNFKEIHPNAFARLGSLKTLLLNNNQLSKINDGAFNGLPNLRYLYLYNNEIADIEPNAFQGLVGLTHLFLNQNRLEKISPRAFKHLPNLQNLHMYDNRLQRLPRGLFDSLKSLKLLRIDKNALICDCGIVNFMTMLKTEMSSVKTQAECSEPVDMKGKDVMRISVNDLHCQKPAVMGEPEDVEISFGNTAYFRCRASGDPSPEITWYHNKEVINMADHRHAIMEDGSLMIKQTTPNDTGVYECLAKNDLGEARSAVVSLKYLSDESSSGVRIGRTQFPLVSRLEFTLKPVDKIAHVGQNVAFECSATGEPAPAIDWTKNGHVTLPRNPRYSIQRSGTLLIRDIQFEDRGIYACTATNRVQKITTSAGVMVYVPPTFAETPRDVQAVEGTPAHLTCRARGYPKPVVEWSRDSVVQPTTSRQSLTILDDGSRLSVTHARQFADSGQYQCKAYNEAGSVTAIAHVSIRSRAPLVITNRPRDVQARQSEEVQFVCTSFADPPADVTWIKDDVVRLRPSVKYSITSVSLTIHDVRYDDAGRYKCIVTNIYDSQVASALLEVIHDRRDTSVADSLVNSSVIEARQGVNFAINQTLRELHDPTRTRSPGDLLTLFRLPSSNALELTRAAETYEQTLEIILREVQKGMKYGVTHQFSNLTYDDVLSPHHLRVIANLSGCSTHRREVRCDNMCFHSKYRTLDGTCNNLQHPLWGASLTPLGRLLPPRYENGINEPVGWNQDARYHGRRLPSARQVSSKILSTNDITEDDVHTLMLMQWGQFLDHDLDFTPIAASNARFGDGRHCNETCANQQPCFPIEVPIDDPRIHRGRCIGFTRSSAICGSGLTSVLYNRVAAREQMNQLTPFIDASNVYGSNTDDANNLRDLETDRGLLKDGITPRNGRSFLPYERTLKVDCQIDPTRAHIPCFTAGDHRANEQLGLLAVHTIFMRLHNRIAEQMRFQNQHWSGDVIYHEVRKIIGAQMQHITYAHWLPKILGPKGMAKLGNYTGYDPSVQPSILNSFATAAFRFGHSLIQPVMYRLDESFEPSSFGNLPLHEAFFAPYRLVEEGGVDPLLRGLYHIGVKTPFPNQIMNTELTERLFKLANSIALDLGSLNIQRGRDHGLPGYNAYREYCGLGKANTFDELRNEIRNDAVRKKLEELYGHPDNIDLFPGAMTENVVDGAKLGPTFMCILVEQFRRLRDGDRFWYESPGVFKPSQLLSIKQTSLATVICETHDGTIERIQKDVFVKTSTDEYGHCDDVMKLDLLLWKDCDLSGGSTLSGQFGSSASAMAAMYAKMGMPGAMYAKMGMPGAMYNMPGGGAGGYQNDMMMEGRLQGMETEMHKMHDMVVSMQRKMRKMEKAMHEDAFCVDALGTQRKHKEKWRESCDICFCKFGKIKCRAEVCAVLTCKRPKLPPGHCCPVC